MRGTQDRSSFGDVISALILNVQVIVIFVKGFPAFQSVRVINNSNVVFFSELSQSMQHRVPGFMMKSTIASGKRYPDMIRFLEEIQRTVFTVNNSYLDTAKDASQNILK